MVLGFARVRWLYHAHQFQVYDQLAIQLCISQNCKISLAVVYKHEVIGHKPQGALLTIISS